MQKREQVRTVAFRLYLQVPERVHDAHIMLPDTARCNAIRENAKESCSILDGIFNKKKDFFSSRVSPHPERWQERDSVDDEDDEEDEDDDDANAEATKTAMQTTSILER